LDILLPSDHKDDCFKKDINLGMKRELSEFKIVTSRPYTWRILKNQPIELNHSDNPINQISENERNSLLKLVLGMAIDAYGYDVNTPRNSTTGGKNGISARLATRGIKLHHETIRKYLKEAEKFL
jgi:hypothetical protein